MATAAVSALLLLWLMQLWFGIDILAPPNRFSLEFSEFFRGVRKFFGSSTLNSRLIFAIQNVPRPECRSSFCLCDPVCVEISNPLKNGASDTYKVEPTTETKEAHAVIGGSSCSWWSYFIWEWYWYICWKGGEWGFRSEVQRWDMPTIGSDWDASCGAVIFVCARFDTGMYSRHLVCRHWMLPVSSRTTSQFSRGDVRRNQQQGSGILRDTSWSFSGVDRIAVPFGCAWHEQPAYKAIECIYCTFWVAGDDLP